MGKESIYLYIYIFIHKCAIFNSYDKLTEGIRKVVCSNNIQTGQSLRGYRPRAVVITSKSNLAMENLLYFD